MKNGKESFPEGKMQKPVGKDIGFDMEWNSNEDSGICMIFNESSERSQNQQSISGVIMCRVLWEQGGLSLFQ